MLLDHLRTLAPWRLELARDLPGVVTLGAEAVARWSLRNPSLTAIRVVVADSLPPSAHASPRRITRVVPARGRATADVELRPTRRGIVGADTVTVRVFGPLGLVCRQADRSIPARCEVHPSFRSRAQAELRLTRGRLLEVGRRSVVGRGGTGELDQLREYRPDDDFRHIDWFATARSPQPVVRAYRPERNQSVVVLLDTGRLMAGLIGSPPPSAGLKPHHGPPFEANPGAGLIREPSSAPILPPSAGGGNLIGSPPPSAGLAPHQPALPRLDHAMDATLALTTVAARLGDRVGLVAFAGEIRALVPPRTGTQQLRAVSNGLFRLQPELAEAAYAGALRTALTRFPRRSLLVLLTELDSQALIDTLVPALGRVLRDHVVVVAGVRDPQIDAWVTRTPTRPGGAYRAAAAASTLRARAETAAQLSARGVQVVDATPDRLPGRLVDAYLDVKARVRL